MRRLPLDSACSPAHIISVLWVTDLNITFTQLANLKAGGVTSSPVCSAVGYVPGSCFSTQLAPGSDYVIIAEVTETADSGLQVRPVDTEIVATQHNIDKVVSACRLMPHYPHGQLPPALAFCRARLTSRSVSFTYIFCPVSCFLITAPFLLLRLYVYFLQCKLCVASQRQRAKSTWNGTGSATVITMLTQFYWNIYRVFRKREH